MKKKKIILDDVEIILLCKKCFSEMECIQRDLPKHYNAPGQHTTYYVRLYGCKNKECNYTVERRNFYPAIRKEEIEVK